jgi:hypothetical protein
MTAPIWLCRLVFAAALLLAALPVSGLRAAEPPAEERPAAAEAESARAVRYTRALEAEPLGDDATAMRLEEGPPAAPFLGSFLHESHIVYPLAVPEGWEVLGEQRYDAPEQGASVRYHRVGDKSGWIDVFYYPVGALNAEQLAKMADTERRNLVTAWEDALTGDPITRLTTFTVPTGRPAPYFIVTAYATDFSYLHRDNKKPYHSAMVLMVDRLYAIKLRYSADADVRSREEVVKETQHFARQLLPQVEISSTGQCGAPEGVVNGKLADGCVGEDPIQPEVGEGQRELRFEYPASR